jgi:hypothetical protein
MESKQVGPSGTLEIFSPPYWLDVYANRYMTTFWQVALWHYIEENCRTKDAFTSFYFTIQTLYFSLIPLPLLSFFLPFLFSFLRKQAIK